MVNTKLTLSALLGTFFLCSYPTLSEAGARWPNRIMSIDSVKEVAVLDFKVTHWEGEVHGIVIQLKEGQGARLIASGEITVQTEDAPSNTLTFKVVEGHLDKWGIGRTTRFSGKIKLEGKLNGAPFSVNGFSYINPRASGTSDIRLFDMLAPDPRSDRVDVLYEIQLNLR